MKTSLCLIITKEDIPMINYHKMKTPVLNFHKIKTSLCLSITK